MSHFEGPVGLGQSPHLSITKALSIALRLCACTGHHLEQRCVAIESGQLFCKLYTLAVVHLGYMYLVHCMLTKEKIFHSWNGL